MKNYIVMSLCAVMLLLVADRVSAKTFYLNDGAAIGYRQVWQQGGTIYLLVNRDTLLEFSPDEVDQRRSLKAAGLKSFPRPAVKERRAAPVVRKKKVQSASTKETDPVEEVVVVYAPAESAARQTAKTSPGRRSAPAQSTDSGDQGGAAELVSVYENLHQAMKSKNVAAVKNYLSSRRTDSFGDREIAMIEAGVSLMPPNRKVTGSSISPDGNTATLSMTTRMAGGSSKPGIGTITFLREDGVWKVDQENWEFDMN